MFYIFYMNSKLYVSHLYETSNFFLSQYISEAIPVGFLETHISI